MFTTYTCQTCGLEDGFEDFCWRCNKTKAQDRREEREHERELEADRARNANAIAQKEAQSRLEQEQAEREREAAAQAENARRQREERTLAMELQRKEAALKDERERAEMKRRHTQQLAQQRHKHEMEEAAQKAANVLAAKEAVRKLEQQRADIAQKQKETVRKLEQQRADIAQKQKETEMRRRKAEAEAALRAQKQSAKLAEERERYRQEKVREALTEYKECMQDTKGKLQAQTARKSELEAAIAGGLQAHLSIDTQIAHHQSAKAAAVQKMDAKVRETKEVFERYDNEIRAVIAKTCVQQQNVSDFLNLTMNMNQNIMAGVQSAHNMSATFKSFAVNLDRECNDVMTIEDYFLNHRRRLARFLPVFIENEFYSLEDLECDDEDEFKEDILLMLETAVSEAIQQKVIDGKPNPLAKKISKPVKKALMKLCLKGQTTWEPLQQQTTNVTKQLLKNNCPPLVTFFERVHTTMVAAGKLAEIGAQFNSQQRLAIENPGPLIEEVIIDDDDDDDQKEDPSNSNINNNNSDNKVVSTIIKAKPVHTNMDLSQINSQNDTLKTVALHSLNIVKSMEREFQENGTSGAKGLAMNVQNTCAQIVSAQFNIRRNIASTMEIARMKPGHITAQGKLMWDAIDDGSIQIYQSSIRMIQIAAEYFGFFLRFRSSFARYLAIMELDDNTAFVVSLKYLKQDLREFKAFQETYSASLENLNKTAMECIAKCVRTAVGSLNFETAQQEYKGAQEKHMLALKELRDTKQEWHDNLLPILKAKTQNESSLAKNKCLLKDANRIIKMCTNQETNWNKEIKNLQHKLSESNLKPIT